MQMKRPNLPKIPKITSVEMPARLTGMLKSAGSALATRNPAATPQGGASPVTSLNLDAAGQQRIPDPSATRHHKTPHDRNPGPPRASIWRALTKPLRLINWRIITAALFGVAILHIVATLAAPSLAIATAFNRLERVLPPNRIIVLPQISPQAQPLPFLTPALRYAMCRFDTGKAPVEVAVQLSEVGSSLTIYSPDGEAIYTAAQSDVTLHRVRIIPADGRFLGLTPEARGEPSTEIPSATLHAAQGVVVYAVPDRGESYRTGIEAQLATASCRQASASGQR